MLRHVKSEDVPDELHKFEGGGVCAVKGESTPQSSLVSCKSESVIDTTSTWAQGLGSGKSLARAMREWSKTNYKHAKLVEFTECAKEFNTFLKDIVQLVTHSSFDLIVMKVCFFEVASSDRAKPISDALSTLFA